MYMSRITVPLDEPQAQKMMSHLHDLHKTVMSAFPDNPGRVLFRIEPENKTSEEVYSIVLVQSLNEPDWDNANLPRRTRAESKEVSPALNKGDVLRFRLRANPTVKKKEEGKKNGKRLGIIGEDNQEKWIREKAQRGGFSVGGVVVVDEGMVTGKRKNGDPSISFRSVRYEGNLRVEDPQEFIRTLEEGIGSAKAFGFGLLSVARA